MLVESQPGQFFSLTALGGTKTLSGTFNVNLFFNLNLFYQERHTVLAKSPQNFKDSAIHNQQLE